MVPLLEPTLHPTPDKASARPYPVGCAPSAGYTVEVGISTARVGVAKAPDARRIRSPPVRPYLVSGPGRGSLTGTRAALYTRVSREEQAEGHSLAGQLRELREYCERQGYSVVRIMPPETASGAEWDRPVFQRLLTLASRGAFDVLVVWRRDRYARDAVGAGYYERTLRRYGVRIEATQTGPQDDSPQTRLVNGMMDLWNEYERASIRDRCALGRKEAALSGEWPGAAPFGYTKAHGLLVVDDLQAPLMREAYAEALRGANRGRIAQLLGCEPTSAIRRLQNPAYKGEAVWDGIKVPCPPIVSPETWGAAQAAIAARYANKGGTNRGPYARWGEGA